jgi:hypothetical protein
MGGFFLVHRDELDRNPELVETLPRPFERRGFARPQRLAGGAYALYRYNKLLAGPGSALEQGDGNRAVAVGTLFCQGRSGTTALKSFAIDYRSGHVRWSQLGEHFA